MTERGWVTLIVRGVGLVLLGIAIYSGLDVLSTFSMLWSMQSQIAGQGYGDWSYWLPQLISPALQLAFGAYLVFGARWLIDRIAREAASGCRACGYPVDKVNPNCPECGTPEPGEKTNP